MVLKPHINFGRNWRGGYCWPSLRRNSDVGSVIVKIVPWCEMSDVVGWKAMVGGVLGIRGTVRDSGDFRSSHALFLTKKSHAGLIMKL